MKTIASTVSTLVLALVVIVSGEATAQTRPNYPSKTVRVVVPFAAGGAVDASARSEFQ